LLIVLTVVAWVGRGNVGFLKSLAEPEVGVATLLMSAAILTVALRPSVATRFQELDVKMLAIDAGLFFGLATYSARSGNLWVICAAALQLISTTAHLARVTTPGMWRLGYQVMEEASSYPTLVLLAWGLWSRHLGARKAALSNSFSEGTAQMRRPPVR